MLPGLVLILLAGCTALPTRPIEPASAPAQNPEDTSLGRALAPDLEQQPGKSGVYPLANGSDAFAARMALAAAAERTLDVQYYIWHRDDTGKLLANQLIQAANRGVHVRLLLDDFGTYHVDANLLALSYHTNIEVRLFNPVANRTFRHVAFLFEFLRTNRRMHNKSFTVDNQVTIIGGRNIGDAYFGAGPGKEFADFDVVAIGPIVKAVSTAFDIYWRSPSSIPIEQLSHEKVLAKWVTRQEATLAAECATLQDSNYFQTARDDGLMNELRAHELNWSWGDAWLVYDLPEKVTTSPEDPRTHLVPHLRPVIDDTEHEVLIISPYFVPGDEGVKFIQALRKRGVRVVIITNSLEATDVAAVTAKYGRYRKSLLLAGVELYEFKPDASLKAAGKKKGSRDSARGSSRASLHAKTFVFDERDIFVGSLNLDARSKSLNTEVGAVFDVPDLATRIATNVKQDALPNCYRLELVPGHGLYAKCHYVNWLDEADGQAIRYTHEPGAGWGKRFMVGILSWLPIESQL